MKKLFTLLAAIVTAIAAFAAGNTMNYQAVLRNADGTVAADKNIGIRFRILGAASTQLFYEALTVKTNDRGMVDCAIGATDDNGLANIDFSADNLRLEVAIDINGGTDYSAVYTSDIHSVAKAIYASHSGDTEILSHHIVEMETYLVMTRDEINALEADSNYLKVSLEEQRVRIMDLETYVNARITELDSKVAELQARNAELEYMVNYLRDEIELLKSKLP